MRGISTDFHYSTRTEKLRENAFAPAPSSLYVSMNRLKYWDATMCKQHAKTIAYPNESVYCGLATIKVQTINQINQNNSRDYPFIKASPMKSREEYYNILTEKVYTDSEGNPAHCDLCYISKHEIRDPKTTFRKIARQFLDDVGIHIDIYPLEDFWTCGSIT